VVCFFCIAVFTLLAGAVSAGTLDTVEDQLAAKATDGVRRVSDTDSVARFELDVDVDGRKAPVAVTVYKEHARVRIQVLTHELTREQIERIEDELAKAVEADVVDRSHPDVELPGDHDHPERDSDKDADDEAKTSRERVKAEEPQRER
jgi:3',5'-cyclic AMP phosphodiesterase CpdA